MPLQRTPLAMPKLQLAQYGYFGTRGGGAPTALPAGRRGRVPPPFNKSPRPESNRILLFTKQVLYHLSFEGAGSAGGNRTPENHSLNRRALYHLATAEQGDAHWRPLVYYRTIDCQRARRGYPTRGTGSRARTCIGGVRDRCPADWTIPANTLHFVSPRGIEPPHSRLKGGRSTFELRARRHGWTRRESNPRKAA